MINLKLKKHKGGSLPISLFVLLGLTISSAALFSNTENNIQIAGNIGLRGTVSQANDTATAIAIKWLIDNQETLKNNNAAQGYISSFPVNLAIDYDNDNSWVNAKKIAADELGNSNRYIIYRLCSQPNTAYNGTLNGVVNICATKVDNTSSNSGNSSGFGAYNFTSNPTLFYKIVVQTNGAKGARITTNTVVGLKAS